MLRCKFACSQYFCKFVGGSRIVAAVPKKAQKPQTVARQSNGRHYGQRYRNI